LTGDLVEIAKGILGWFPLQLIDEMGPPESKFTSDIFDVILGIGLDLQQSFNLNFSDLVPTLLLPDGTTQSLTLGKPATIANASTQLGGLNPDGTVNFTVGLLPQATLTNDTSLGGNMNVTLTAGQFAYKAIDVTLYHSSFNVPLGNLG